MRHILSAFAIIGCTLICGCKADLYTQLSERDANAMLAVLIASGVNAQKNYVGDQGVNVVVEEADLARAIDILAANGFPREEKDTMGKVFARNGIMSSPFEERVRYIYALEEGVSKTLGEIDGILSARVHIVLPDAEGRSDVVQSPPSAAVFIKHRRGLDLDFFIPQIRRLVSNAIKGVDYDSVTVASVEAEPPQVPAGKVPTLTLELIPGLGIRADDAGFFWSVVLGVGIAFSLLVASNLLTLVAFIRRRRSVRGAGATTADELVE